ncbi:MAG: prepilin peptidase [Planctomycetes bacterium]|nr:prepilin peptidase [Planctomycetota bacterium]
MNERFFIQCAITLAMTLIFGIYFSYTDITRRTIPNRPLLIFLIFGLFANMLTIFTGTNTTGDILLALTLASGLGFGSYYFNLWHGGDGKLFIAATLNITPLALYPLKLVIFNFCLSLALCYLLLFLWLLFKSIIRGKLWIVLLRTGWAVFSVERLCQAIFTYSVSLIIQLNIDVTLRTVVIYLLFYLIQSRLNRYFTGRIKIWHIYALLAIGLLALIKTTNNAFPLINLLHLFGFIFLVTLYFSLDFFSHLAFFAPDGLKAGMELAYNLYKSGRKIIGSPFIRNDAEIVMKAPKELTESDINYLKEKEREQKMLRIPVRGAAQSIPFAPFIIASALFILLKLLLQQLR